MPLNPLPSCFMGTEWQGSGITGPQLAFLRCEAVWLGC